METKLTKENIEFIKELTQNYKQLERRIKDDTAQSSNRHVFSQDYSRILYSTSLRRLQGKMQFLSVASNQFYRNRLTHSHEVVQIARTIAGAIRNKAKDENVDLKLYGSDMYVIESACLAHDIGNPPFGHAGERVLNDLMKCKGGYEGNAQTFRVLNTLERRFPNEKGLFLSKRTLLSVVKYFNRGEINKKFLYDSDFDSVQLISQECGIKLRTLDAQIMDVADEIAYAAHDLEDALKLRLFTIDDLMFEFKRSQEFSTAYDKFVEIVMKARGLAEKSDSDSSEDYTFFFTKQLTSIIVNTLVEDIAIVPVAINDKETTSTMNEQEIGYKDFEKLANGLKKLTFQCITRKPEILLYEKRGEVIIKGLFTLFNDVNFNKNLELLPIEYRNLKKNGETNCRIVCDYISGMMDTSAIEIYKKYYGRNSLDSYYFA
jgi:dGTPase